MNVEEKQKLPNDYDNIIHEDDSKVQGESASAFVDLEQISAKDRDRMKEERFYLVSIIIILFNVIIFGTFDNWSGPVCITFLEIVVLLPFASHCQIEEVAMFIDKILRAYSGK